MANIIYYPNVSCLFSCNGYIYNQSGSPLVINKFSKIQGMCKNELCITINATDIEFISVNIKHALLRFSIQRLSSPIYCFQNQLSVTARAYSNLEICDLAAAFVQPVNHASFKYNCFQVDISNIIKEWNYKQFPMLKVFLSLTTPNLYIQICNEHGYFPELMIEYTKLPTPPDPKPVTPCMLSISSRKINCSIMNPNEKILFDTIDENIASDIMYDTTSKTFSFVNTGYYFIQWVINIRGSTSTNCISIGLRNETTGEMLGFPVPNTAPLEIYGHHILHIYNTTMNYSLVNASDAPIQFSYAPIQASLIIFKIT